MSRKIKLHSLHFLFQIFSFLADKSGGWKLFVKPKLIIGSLILGLGFTACNKTTKATQKASSEIIQTQSKEAISVSDTSNDSIGCYTQIEILPQIYEKVPAVNNNEIYEITEQMPQFPGGDKALFKYLSSEIRYPILAKRKGIQGRVIVRFVVDKKGNIEQIQVVRSVEPSLDKEALRVIKCMPKWTPGKQNGVNVNVWFTLPINFKLQ